MAEGYDITTNFSSGPAIVLDKITNASMEVPGDAGGPPPEQPLLKQSTAMVVVFCVAYMLVFIFAIVNNSLVVSVIIKNHQMHTVTNYFLANLAVADILVSVLVLPITLLSNLFYEWQFGAFLCKATPYLQAVVVSASVNTLVAVAAERYFAIFHPGSRVINPNLAMIIIAVTWLIPVCLQTPWALYFTMIEFGSTKTTICLPQFPNEAFEKGFFLGVMFLTCYLVPLVLISICYIMVAIKVWKRNVSGIKGTQAEKNIQRSKIRIVRMLITVTVVFAMAWLPLYAIRMRILFGTTMGGTERWIVTKTLVPIAQWLGSATSAANPVIYCYFSEQFRKYIVAIFAGCRRPKAAVPR